jgi:hypothetical protein
VPEVSDSAELSGFSRFPTPSMLPSASSDSVSAPFQPFSKLNTQPTFRSPYHGNLPDAPRRAGGGELFGSIRCNICLWPAWRSWFISTRANCRVITSGRRRNRRERWNFFGSRISIIFRRVSRRDALGCIRAGNWPRKCLPVVIPEEFNTPPSANIPRSLWTEPCSFRFDPRLFGSEPRTL